MMQPASHKAALHYLTPPDSLDFMYSDVPPDSIVKK